VFYGDRPTFDADYPGLPVEGFENTLVPPGAITACPGPFDSTTNNACFAPGGILDGIQFNNADPANDMVVIGTGALGNPSVWIGPNTFVDHHDILFLDGGVAAVGFDLYSPLATDTYNVYIYGPGDVLIGQTSVLAGAAGTFFGVASDAEPITRIRTEALAGSGELVDDVAFGGVAAAGVPWIWEDPISGTVAALGGMTNVDIYFTAVLTDPLPLGSYNATLRVGNNDPVAGTQNVPATMHIVEAYMAPTALFTPTTPVMVREPAYFENGTYGGVPWDYTYLWDFGDGYTDTVESPTHIYDTVGIFTVTLEACNYYEGSFHCDTDVKPVEVIGMPTFLPILLRNH
jgi:hypothetical protein